MSRISLIILLTLAASLAGCSQGAGFIIKPIPLKDQVVENVVAADPGLLIGDRIAVVDVDGLIMNHRNTGGLLGPRDNPVSLFVEKMDKAQADGRVKALVVRINSPGGGVTASDIIYRRVTEFRQARKVPVIAVIEDVGASGGYYIACSADAIIAHPTSITGSIGVIVQTISLAGTMKMIGVQTKALTSGAYKDMGSPLKPLDEKDQAIIQAMVNEFYQRFVSVVAAGRPKLTPEKVKDLSDGRVYTGQQALDNGLVDSLGYVSDAIALAKKLSGASRVKVVMYARPWGQKQNIYSQASDSPPQLNLINVNMPSLMSLSQPQFLYLWTSTL